MKIFRIHKRELRDEELLVQYRKFHENEVIGVLYTRYIHLVYGLCLKYLKSREDAEDAAMNIFEIISVKLKSQEVVHFKSWLYIVAKNYCLMHLRQTTKTEVLNGAFMESGVNSHLMYEDSDEQLDSDLNALEQCIQELRQSQQECVRLFYLKQKSYQEISMATSFRLGKVKGYIQNGKRNLRICLEKKYVKR